MMIAKNPEGMAEIIEDIKMKINKMKTYYWWKVQVMTTLNKLVQQSLIYCLLFIISLCSTLFINRNHHCNDPNKPYIPKAKRHARRNYMVLVTKWMTTAYRKCISKAEKWAIDNPSRE